MTSKFLEEFRLKSLRNILPRAAAARGSFLGRTIEQVLILSATHAVSGFLVLGTFMLLANRLGPSLYGEFTFADSVVFLGVLCASLGTEYVGNREVARSRDARELVSGILILRALASLTAFAVVVSWALVFSESEIIRALMLITGGVLLTVPGIAGWFFLARHRVRTVAAVTLARETAFFLPVLFILDRVDDPEKRLIYAAVFYLASKLLFAAIFFVRLMAENGFTLQVKTATYRLILKDSLALLYASLVSSLTISAQVYMLKLLGDDYSLGVYGALFKQIFYIQMLSLSFIMVFFPLLSRAWVEDRSSYDRLASALSELTLVVVLPVALTGILYPDYLMSLFFTDEYSAGAPTLQVLCLSLIPMSYVRVLTTGVLISMDMTSKMYTLVNITFVATLFSGVFILAFQRADLGAAVSRLVSEAVFAAISYWTVAKRVRVISYGVLKSLLAGTAAMGMVRLAAPAEYALAGLLASYAAFFAAYSSVVVLTRLDELRRLLKSRCIAEGQATCSKYY